MTVGPRASTERNEDQREVRGEMTLTVEYSEMTAKIVKHFKMCVCVCVHAGVHACGRAVRARTCVCACV